MTSPAYRFGPRPGDVVTVSDVPGAYRLPDGLVDGDRVTLRGFDHGYWDCEKDATLANEGKILIGATLEKTLLHVLRHEASPAGPS